MRETQVSSISYISRLVWHFVRDKKDDDGKIIKPSYDILEDHILRESGNGKLLPCPNPSAEPPWDKYYIRFLQPEVRPSDQANTNDNPHSLLQVLEQRAVCFADIPFNFLPIHMNRYSGIGLGFRRKLLSLRHDDLQPVQYIPRFNDKEIKKVLVNPEECSPGTLKKYIKVSSVKTDSTDGETFEG